MRLFPAPIALVATAACLLLSGAPGSAAGSGLPVTVVSLSNRADLVSGGDVLLQVRVPSGAKVREVRLNGHDVTRSFAVRSDGRYLGVVRGLVNGKNQVVARTTTGSGAQLVVTNHPIGGPVFAGPQVQPWLCTTASNGLGAPKDAQCNAPTTYLLTYKDAVTGQMSSYDPASPPAASQIATTTTDTGVTVPYIVRDERGTLDRAIYDIAVLYDPSKPWAPWQSQAGWDHKLGFTFGGGCAPGHSQQAAQNPVDDLFLSRGYMKAVSSINVNGNACNAQTSAEALMMIKEHIAETYGRIRFTIGDGCSGGAEQQHMIADKYPGLLDGLRPECDFPDLWTPAIWEKFDCVLFTKYFNETSPQLWAVEAQRSAVTGGPLTSGDCAEQTAFNAVGLGGPQQDWQPDSIGCGMSGAFQYNATTNRRGVRCTLQDYNVSSLGRRKDGFANRPVDHVGVQWGLASLAAGTILPEQFVDLNAKIGGLDIDFQPQAARNLGDAAGISNMYANSELAYTRNWAKVPEIDARADDSYDEHSNVMRFIDRARLDAAVGSHASQVFWTEPSLGAFGGASSGTHALSLQVMDQWLTNIERDTRPGSQEAKVVRDRPALAHDGCFQSGKAVAQSLCDAVQTPDVLPIQVAGMPMAANVLKCQLKPLNMSDYLAFGVHFTADQWSRMQTAFPHGVCDWTKKGVGQQRPKGDWLSYSGLGVSVPLGSAPVSTPLAAQAVAAPARTGVLAATGGLPLAPLAALLLVIALLVRQRARSLR